MYLDGRRNTNQEKWITKKFYDEKVDYRRGYVESFLRNVLLWKGRLTHLKCGLYLYWISPPNANFDLNTRQKVKNA